MTRISVLRAPRAVPGTGSWTFPLEVAGTVATLKIVKRAANRRLRLCVKDGQVHVSAPPRISHAQVMKFVSDHHAWIADRLRQIPSVPALPTPFVTDTLPCGGRQLSLSWKEGLRPAWEKTSTGVCFTIPRDRVKQWPQWVRPLVAECWMDHMRQVLAEDRDRCVAGLGRAPTRVVFKRVKSLWGSLNARNEVMLDIALALAPPAVLRYVWIHELCHLRERNHSSRFWGWVAQFYPEWKRCRDWLRGPNGEGIKTLAHTWLG